MPNDVRITVSGDSKDAEAAMARTRHAFGKLQADLRLTDADLRRIGRSMTLWGAGLTALGFFVIKSAMARDASGEAAHSVERFKDSMAELSAVLGKHLLPALTSIASNLASFVEGLNRFLDNHQVMARMVVTVGALTAGLLTFGGVALITTVSLGKLAAAIRLVSLAIASAHPLLLALMVAVGAGVFVWANWGTIMERSRGIWV